jgi:ethanolamine ammonia-lyase large subunit
MLRFGRTLGSHVYRFDDPKTVLARASSGRPGDELAGIAAQARRGRRMDSSHR